MTTEISTKVLENLVIEFCEIHINAPGAEEFRDYLLERYKVREARERGGAYGLDPQVTERAVRFTRETEEEGSEIFFRLKLHLPSDKDEEEPEIYLYIGTSDTYPDDIVYIYFQDGDRIFDRRVEKFVDKLISVESIGLSSHDYPTEKQLLKTLKSDKRSNSSSKYEAVYEFDDFKSWKHH